MMKIERKRKLLAQSNIVENSSRYIRRTGNLFSLWPMYLFIFRELAGSKGSFKKTLSKESAVQGGFEMERTVENLKEMIRAGRGKIPAHK